MIVAGVVIAAGVLIHELGHIKAARLIGCQARLGWRWTPVPMPVCRALQTTPSRGVAIAGPAASLAFAAVVFYASLMIGSVALFFGSCDAALFSLVSLLPFGWLDGRAIWR